MAILPAGAGSGWLRATCLAVVFDVATQVDHLAYAARLYWGRYADLRRALPLQSGPNLPPAVSSFFWGHHARCSSPPTRFPAARRRAANSFYAGAGLLTYIIRVFGGYPDGAAFAILLMNLCVPVIDLPTQSPIFGMKDKA